MFKIISDPEFDAGFLWVCDVGALLFIVFVIVALVMLNFSGPVNSTIARYTNDPPDKPERSRP